MKEEAASNRASSTILRRHVLGRKEDFEYRSQRKRLAEEVNNQLKAMRLSDTPYEFQNPQTKQAICSPSSVDKTVDLLVSNQLRIVYKPKQANTTSLARLARLNRLNPFSAVIPLRGSVAACHSPPKERCLSVAMVDPIRRKTDHVRIEEKTPTRAPAGLANRAVQRWNQPERPDSPSDTRVLKVPLLKAFQAHTAQTPASSLNNNAYFR